jgi:hypothetical protein
MMGLLSLGNCGRQALKKYLFTYLYTSDIDCISLIDADLNRTSPKV